MNEGTLTLGNGSDTLTFAGGLSTDGNGGADLPSTVTLSGTINTTNTQMDLGAVTLAGTTVLDTGNNALGILNVGAVTSATNALTLDSGSTAGATIGLGSFVDASGGLTIRDAGGLVTLGDIGSSGAGVVTITDSTSGVTFSANVDATTLTITDTEDAASVTFADGQDVDITAGFVVSNAGSDAYNVVINSSTFDAAGDTNFLNEGTLTLGNGSDTLTFAGGLSTDGNGGADLPSTVTLSGTINTTNTQMDLGAVTLAGTTVLDTGNNALGILNVGAVTSATNALTLDSGATAGATIGLGSFVDASGGLTIRDAGGLVTLGDIGSSGAGVVTITDSTSGVTFSANVDATTLTITDTEDAASVTFADGQDVDITAGFVVSNAGSDAYNVVINSSTFDAAGDTNF